jgi:cytochrome c-type biogenesis protein CcmH
MKTAITIATLTVLMVAFVGGAQSEDPALEAQAADIDTLLIAPCCWSQPISDHQSEIAIQMRGEVRNMLRAGMGRQEILDAYVEQYGARILSIPPQQGFNRLTFVMPAVFAAVGLFVIVAVLRRFRRATAKAAVSVSDSAVARRVEEELNALDEP